MGKSEHGPDMLDCSQYAHTIERASECTVTILIAPAGYEGGSTLHVHVLIQAKDQRNFEPVWSVASMVTWPHREFKHFESALYACLVKADAEIGRTEFMRTVGLT